MTDRHKGFMITLDRDYRDDDSKQIKKAIEMIKGVIKVDPIPVKGSDIVDRNRIKFELQQALYNVLE